MSRSYPPTFQRPQRVTLALLALTCLSLTSACEDPEELTAPGTPAASVVLPSDGDAGLVPTDQTFAALGTVPLPINQSYTGTGLAFGITQLGTGPTGSFKINKTTSAAAALLGQTNGTGNGVRGLATGQGRAGFFQINNPSNNNNALEVTTNGGGGATAIIGYHTGAFGQAGAFITTNAANLQPALLVRSASDAAILVENVNRFDGFAPLIEGNNAGLGSALSLRNTNPGGNATISATSTGAFSYAGRFENQNGNGVFISAGLGKVGLQVVGGTKNAVVGTTTGARALYTEESSEVWFTDYGFGSLEQGRARILIDPTFAQTINPEEPYHVFLEEYGDAQLYVAERTSLGFVVRSRTGDPDVEFSYRLVARRLGYEKARLERTPPADQETAALTR